MVKLVSACGLGGTGYVFSVCVCTAQLQQSLLVFGRSTRKLIRDVMEEQQRALDILSSQVRGGLSARRLGNRVRKHPITAASCSQVTELMSKVQTLSSEVQRSNAEMFSIKPVQSHGNARRP